MGSSAQTIWRGILKTPSFLGQADHAFSLAVYDNEPNISPKSKKLGNPEFSKGNHLTMILLCLLKHLQHSDAVAAIKNILWEMRRQHG